MTGTVSGPSRPGRRLVRTSLSGSSRRGLRQRVLWIGLSGGPAWWGWRHLRSTAVAAWSPSRGPVRHAGPLQVRVLGAGETVVLLLHGMIGAGNSFGAVYDALAEHATVVVPDLLGFGGSRNATGPSDALAHVAALDASLSALGLRGRRTIVAGHSMGGALALYWAAAHTDDVRSVVTFGAPLYRTRTEADVHVAGMGRAQALLAGDGPLPRAVCAWMCRHRTAASWVAAASRPDLPVPVARSGVQHTWDSYTGSLNGLIRDAGWAAALDGLGRAQVPVVLANGANDPVPVPGRAAELASTWPTITHLTHHHAGHGLPLTHPDWCRRLVTEALDPQVDQVAHGEVRNSP